MKLALVAAIAVLAPAVAYADEWTPSQDFQRSQVASLRVVEPEGYKVTVNGRADTAPAVFNFDNADNYVLVRFEAPGGASWEKKIEVKAYHQTVLRVRHVKAVAAAPDNKAVRTYVGVAANTSHLCKKPAERVAIKMEIVKETVVKSFELQPKSTLNVDLPEGTYDVRVYKPLNGQWAYTQTIPRQVTKDGWVLEFGCGK